MTSQPHMRYYEAKVLDPFEAKRQFNPRFLDFNEVYSTARDPDRNFAYRELDRADYSITILNFSHRVCHIGYRDGSVTTLRNTTPSEIEGKRCYLANLHQYVDGSWCIPKMETDYRKQVPHVPEGIYFLVRKSISTSTTLANKGDSTILYDDTETGNKIVGSGYAYLLKKHEGFTKQRQYAYTCTNEYKEEKLAGYAGPTYFSGECDNDIRNKRLGKDQYRPGNRHHEALWIEYFIPMADLTDVHQQYLYVEDLDLVISTSLSRHQVVHPYSVDGKLTKQLHDASHTDQGSALSGISFINIDNRGGHLQSNVFYANLGGMITKIPAMRNEAQRDGLYIYRHHSVEEDGSTEATETIYLTHSEVLSHTRKDIPAFFRTYSEATALGNLLEKEKEKQRQLEFEQNSQLANMKLELEKKKAELEKLKQEYDQLAMKRKDYYEDRSYRRKDESEWLKWAMGVGGLVVGVGISILRGRS